MVKPMPRKIERDERFTPCFELTRASASNDSDYAIDLEERGSIDGIDHVFEDENSLIVYGGLTSGRRRTIDTRNWKN